MKRILFICDHPQSFSLGGDSTYLLMMAASELGYTVYYCLPQDLYSINDAVYAHCASLSILTTFADLDRVTQQTQWYSEDYYSKEALIDYEAVMVRNDPPFNMEYYYLTQLLSVAEKQGARIINNSHALRTFNEKIAILNFPQYIAPTLVTKSKQAIYEFIEKYDTCVIKPLDLMAGRGVFKIGNDEINKVVIIETITNFYTRSVMVQQFIPEVSLGDKRIFIIHGEVMPYCLRRIPPHGQIRSNLAAGGIGEVSQLEGADYQLASQVNTWLTTYNICFAGLDVIGHKLTEINITSPTGLRKIFNDRGINLAQQLIAGIK